MLAPARQTRLRSRAIWEHKVVVVVAAAAATAENHRLP
jgi:hypothetical protein